MGLILRFLLALSFALPAQAQQRYITVASTTSTEQSGLFRHLLPIFEQKTGIQVRVVALGSRAEYGSYSGAAIDVLTRSGSNELHGSVAAYSKLGDPASNQPGPGDDLGEDWLYVGQGEQLPGGRVHHDRAPPLGARAAHAEQALRRQILPWWNRIRRAARVIEDGSRVH